MNVCVSFVPKLSVTTNFVEKAIYRTEKDDVTSKSIATVSQNFELRFAITVKEGDIVEMQEDPVAIIEQQKERMRPTTSQISTHRQVENQSKNWPQQWQLLWEEREWEIGSDESRECYHHDMPQR